MLPFIFYLCPLSFSHTWLTIQWISHVALWAHLSCWTNFTMILPNTVLVISNITSFLHQGSRDAEMPSWAGITMVWHYWCCLCGSTSTDVTKRGKKLNNIYATNKKFTNIPSNFFKIRNHLTSMNCGFVSRQGWYLWCQKFFN